MPKRKKKSWASYTFYQNKTDFEKTILRDKEGHIIMTKGSIKQENITLAKIYIPNVRAPKHIKQI